MCLPYLDDLKSRVLNLNESLRSARLHCFEVRTQKLIPQHAEPILFTAKQLTNQVVLLVDEINVVIAESTKWNSTTSEQVIQTYFDEASMLRTEVVEVIEEAFRLRSDTTALGLPLEECWPNDDLDQLRTAMASNASLKTNSPSWELAEKQLAEYETSPEIRANTLEQLRSRLPRFFQALSN